MKHVEDTGNMQLSPSPSSRALAVAIVRSAEAPRKLTEDEITAQLPSLARVLTAGYRRQVSQFLGAFFPHSAPIPLVLLCTRCCCSTVWYKLYGYGTSCTG